MRRWRQKRQRQPDFKSARLLVRLPLDLTRVTHATYNQLCPCRSAGMVSTCSRLARGLLASRSRPQERPRLAVEVSRLVPGKAVEVDPDAGLWIAGDGRVGKWRSSTDTEWTTALDGLLSFRGPSGPCSPTGPGSSRWPRSRWLTRLGRSGALRLLRRLPYLGLRSRLT